MCFRSLDGFWIILMFCWFLCLVVLKFCSPVDIWVWLLFKRECSDYLFGCVFVFEVWVC